MIGMLQEIRTGPGSADGSPSARSPEYRAKRMQVAAKRAAEGRFHQACTSSHVL